MYRKFASITSDQHAYAYDSDAYSRDGLGRRHNGIETNFRMFQVLGDGLCQHSPDWSVTTEHAADFFLSLAAELVKVSPGDEDGENLIRCVASAVLNGAREDQIDFASKVLFKESDREYSKQRYFSVREQKTGNKSKEFDKRYQRIEEWCDGSPRAIYRICCPEYSDQLEQLCVATSIHDWCSKRASAWMQKPAQFLNWFGEDEHGEATRRKVADLTDAFEALRNIVKSFHLRLQVKCTIGNYLRSNQKSDSEAA